jgi:DNA-binding beta-propeller fold protein YncE
LTPVYQNEGTTVFAVNGQYTGAMPMTTIEHVPEVETETEEVTPQSEEGQLRQPRGIGVDSEGNIYVADFGNHRIQKFNANLEFVFGWGEEGNLPGQFKQPSSIFVGPNDDIYVTDTWNQRIQVFNKDGEYLREWGAAFFGPRGIAINDEGQVFIVDTGNHKVRRFGIDGMEQLSWGGPGNESGQFKEPVGITTDADGQVYVCDNGNERVQIFTENGKLLRTFPVDGWGQRAFSEPHILVTDKGTAWVTVPDAREVRAYDREGKLLETIRGSEDRSGLFQKPMGIALMPGGNELVISDLEGRLVKLPLGAGGRFGE